MGIAQNAHMLIHTWAAEAATPASLSVVGKDRASYRAQTRLWGGRAS